MLSIIVFITIGLINDIIYYVVMAVVISCDDGYLNLPNTLSYNMQPYNIVKWNLHLLSINFDYDVPYIVTAR